MARGVNKEILVGRLGADPEMKYTANSTALCTFRLATNERYKDREGNWQERTEWHRVVVWGKMGENCGQYLSKGREVYVEGSLRTRSWDDQSGNKRYMTEVVARDVQFLGGQGGGGQAGGGPAGGEDFGAPPGDDDIPF